MIPTVLGSDYQRAAAIIRSGGVVAFPTDTVFGLGCSIYSPPAIARVLAVKGRGSDKGIPVLIANLAEAAALVEITPAFQILAELFWPGALTIVSRALPDQPTEILAPDGTIGLRIPGSDLARHFLEAAGCPVVGTSANRTGEQPLSCASAARDEFRGEVDYILVGETPLTTASTVVSVARDPARVLRIGAIPLSRYRKRFRIWCSQTTTSEPPVRTPGPRDA